MFPLCPTFSIGVILLAQYCFYRAITPPQPAALASEKRGPDKKQSFVSILRFQSVVLKPLLQATFLLEVYGVWADASKSSSLSQICDASARNRIFPEGSIGTATFIGAIMIIAGGYTRMASYTAMGSLYTWEVSVKKDHRLVTTGPYSYVRHPGYTGSFLVSFGYMVFLGSSGTVLKECIGSKFPLALSAYFWINTIPSLFSSMYLARRSWIEDALMKKEFGVQWDEWKEKTPYRFIPYVI